MPDYRSRQIFKLKAPDRWENDGGRFSSDRLNGFRNGFPSGVHEKESAYEHPKADRNIQTENKRRQIYEHQWKVALLTGDCPTARK
jgi:hypothetical protein